MTPEDNPLKEKSMAFAMRALHSPCSVALHSRGARSSFGGNAATLHSAATPPPFIRGAAALFIAVAAAATAAASPALWRQADFAADLYRRSAAVSGADENVVLSPWGVANLFAMLQTGARGDTAKGMAFALQLGGTEPPAPDENAATFHEARTNLSRAANDDVALELSDSLWLKPGFALSESFRSLARDAFDADVRFTEMGAKGREAINGFVAEKTHGRIQNLIQHFSMLCCNTYDRFKIFTPV